MTASGPALSICVATTAGWPAVERCIRSFLDDAKATGSEIIVADGSGRPPPADPEIKAAVTWRTYEERSIVRLIQHSLAEATGQIVATIDDHGTARPGWVAAIFRAHTDHPKAAAIGGAIENGTTDTPLEWASYLTTQGMHMAPLENGPTTQVANEANISYKREALAGFLDDPMGFMTTRVTSALAERGAELINDDRIVVDHHERVGTRAAVIAHFDTARTTSGFRRRQMAGDDWLRLLGAPVLPLYRTARVVRNAVNKGRGGTAATALPWILVLEYWHEVGEIAGYVAGTGRRPSGRR